MPKENEMSRRKFLMLSAGAAATAALGGIFHELTRTKGSTLSSENLPSVETQAEILNFIRELSFPAGSEIRGTIMPRKIMWELVQVLKAKREWYGETDESDWFHRPEILAQALKTLAEAGVTGGRLAVFSSELTEDGESINWEPMELAIEMMAAQNMTAELSGGPLDYPYHPGIRLPRQLREQLQREAQEYRVSEVTIGMQPDINCPDSTAAIRDFALRFWQQQLERYGDDPRVEKFYLGNEWPDQHGIEGLDGVKVTIANDLMLEFVRIAKRTTSKKIALNTNIPVSNLRQLRRTFSVILGELGEQGVLGFDWYPTLERENFLERLRMNDYANMMAQVRELFPTTEIVSTEYQFDPWPPSELTGDSWQQIYEQHPDLVTAFYEQDFAPSLESHGIASQIEEYGMWGLPTMLVLKELGYTFPFEMLQAMREAMDRAA